MIVFSKPYQGYSQGQIVQLATSTEASLIANGFATASAGPVTAGAVTVPSNQQQGRVTFAAAATSLVVTHPSVTAESKVFAVIEQAAADGTFTTVARVLCANGSFTIYANAAATAATTVGWFLASPSGQLNSN
jgi:hypothetical protein